MSDGRSRPPIVDDGERSTLAATVLEALEPAPGRLRSTLLVVAPMLVVLLIWETFRIPQPAIATFLLIVMARGDARSTVSSALHVGATVSLGALIAIVVLSLSLSQPALRIPLMAVMTFTAMFLLRATTLGPVALLTGFFATYGSTEADNLMGLALAPAQVTNTEGFGRPAIAFYPPEEALVHALLWLGAAAAIPALLLAVSERVAGADPRRLLLAKLRSRAAAIAAYCRGEEGAVDRLQQAAKEGFSPLLDLIGASEQAHGVGVLHEAHVELARALNRLPLLLLAWDIARTRSAATPREAQFLGHVEAFSSALDARWMTERRTAVELPPRLPDDEETDLGGALPSLAAEVRHVLDRICEAEGERVAGQGRRGPAIRLHKPFWRPDPFSAANVQFALKVTLTVMSAYLIETGFAWQAISTCVVVCFLSALGTVGETLHKLMLRIVGCLIGAVLGLGAILFLMPSMTSFGQLLILFAPVAFASAWIAFGSPRIAYAGWQILLAFGLTVLQGNGPTLDMQTASNRVIGIALGNLIVSLVFRSIWPVRVADAVRRDLAAACETLGKLMALEDGATAPVGRHATEHRLHDAFNAAVARVGAVFPNDRFEPPHAADEQAGHLDRTVLGRLSRLIVPVSVIATDGLDPLQRDAIPQRFREDVRGFHHSMQAWFGEVALWIRTGQNQERLAADLPRPPLLDETTASSLPSILARRLRGRLALYDLLRQQAADLLDAALPNAGTQRESSYAGRDLSLAVG